MAERNPASEAPLRVGLIVNPVAGLGGRVGLKGTDGADTVRLAQSLGARPEAVSRAARMLTALSRLKPDIDLLAYAGEMGETAVRQVGVAATTIGVSGAQRTTGDDTASAAQELAGAGCDLIVFVGGDGTARDVMRGLGPDLPILGVPAGCKMHSGVFATSPENAARVIAAFAEPGRRTTMLRRAEVMDIDESAFRQNRVSAELHGLVQVPYLPQLMQVAKSSRPATERAELAGICSEFDRILDQPGLFLVAGGSTTYEAATALGLEKTLLGVDAIEQRRTVRMDLGERQILELAERKTLWLVISVIGAQGYIFGRGNQQLSAEVIRRAGRGHIVVIATLSKLLSLPQRRLLVDTGDAELDRALCGHMRVHVGHRNEVVMPVGV